MIDAGKVRQSGATLDETMARPWRPLDTGGTRVDAHRSVRADGRLPALLRRLALRVHALLLARLLRAARPFARPGLRATAELLPHVPQACRGRRHGVALLWSALVD